MKLLVNLTIILHACFIMHAQVVGTITTVAGPCCGGDGVPATASGVGATGMIQFDNYGNYYFSTNYNFVRKVDITGIIHRAAGTGSYGFSGDGGQATNALLARTIGIALDSLGNLFIADENNHRIRKVNITTGIITTFVGTGTAGFSGDGGPATSAQLNNPYGLAMDRIGNLYIGDYSHFRIRKVDTSGIISTYAGIGSYGHSGDGGPADSATIGLVQALCTDKFGNLYLSDEPFVRKIDALTGIITTVAGNGTSSSGGDGGPATAAGLIPSGIAVNGEGYLYIVDNHSANVRVVDTFGIIHTCVGTGFSGYNGDGGRSDTSQISNPYGIAVDSCGNAFICDNGNGRIRKVTFSTTDTPSLSITSTADTICAGTSVTFTAATSGGGSITTYQWHVDTVAVTGATSNTYTYAPASGDSVKCSVATWNRCSSVSYATSNTLHMVVYPLDTPMVSIAPLPNDTVCLGTSVTYTATVSGGGSSPALQWVVNGGYVGAGATSYTYTPTNNDSITCILTGSGACATTTHDTSNFIIMVVDSVFTPAITITASHPDTICGGTSVTYTARVSGGGASPALQWFRNGSSVGSGTTSFTYTPSNGDTLRCILTASARCSTTPHDTSNLIAMVVDSVVTPAITITASHPDTICTGTVVTYTATFSGGGASPTLQWFRNSSPVGSGTTSFTFTPTNGDTLRCLLTGSARCSTTPHDTSNLIVMVVDSVVTPAITITASHPDTICAGTSVTFTATVSGGGASPALQWFRNGSPVGSGTISFTYTPSNGDTLLCMLTGSARCATATQDTSNAIVMVVDSVATPTIVITPTPDDTVCSVNVVTLTATTTHGGTTPTLQWLVNGLAVGFGDTTYTYPPSHRDSIRCVLTSSVRCATTTTVSSNTITMSVDTLERPVISLSAPATAHMGSTVTVTATLARVGSSYLLHWSNRGTWFGTTTTPTISYTKTLPIDSITAKVVPDETCYDSTWSRLITVYPDETSLAAHTARETLTLQPNPTNNQLSLMASFTIHTVAITNLLGQTVITESHNDKNIAIDMKSVPAGLYLVRVNGVYVQRVVKE